MTPDEAINIHLDNPNWLPSWPSSEIADMIRALVRERDAARKALRDLMPFVLEDYWPHCATPAYKAAVEAAKAILDSISGT